VYTLKLKLYTRIIYMHVSMLIVEEESTRYILCQYMKTRRAIYYDNGGKKLCLAYLNAFKVVFFFCKINHNALRAQKNVVP